MAAMELARQLNGVSRCPHCGIANPQLLKLWISDKPLPRATPGSSRVWGLYWCTSCGNAVSAKGKLNANVGGEVEAIFPTPKLAHEDIPEVARRFLQQAYETLHAPDAAAVMAGSAVDAMLKALKYEDGTLYSRIDKAVEDHALTKSMGDWAHEVRLGSNRPRHSDKENPHLTRAEATQSVEFAEALAQFLFVLKARVDRGIAAAKKAASGQ